MVVEVFAAGQAEGGGEIVVSANPEGAELGVGVVVDAYLVVEQLLDQDGRDVGVLVPVEGRKADTETKT